MITQKDVFFDRARACQLIAAMLASNDTGMKIDLPPPCIWKVCHIRICHEREMWIEKSVLRVSVSSLSADSCYVGLK